MKPGPGAIIHPDIPASSDPLARGLKPLRDELLQVA